jgi:hypothetical protein
MADMAAVADECAPSVLNSNKNRIVKCTNCVQMKEQLDDALLQFEISQ